MMISNLYTLKRFQNLNQLRRIIHRKLQKKAYQFKRIFEELIDQMKSSYLYIDEQILIEPLTYNRVYQHISKYVKSLRQKKVKLGSIQLSNLNKFSTTIVDFLSTTDVYKHHLFLQALITLDNIFNIQSQIMRTLIFSKQFFININKYFLRICLNEFENQSIQNHQHTNYQKFKQKKSVQNYIDQQQPIKITTVNFQLYSTLYLIVMLIYQTNRRQDHKQFSKYLLNSQFLTHFFSLDFTKINKIQKLVGIIITYLVKIINVKQWGKSIKRFLLNNIQIAKQKKIQFYLFYSLRTIKDILLLSEIRKFNIIEFLCNCLEKYSGTHQAYYIYDLLETIMKKYPILGYQIIHFNIFSYLQKDLLRHQNQIFKLFELLGQCIPLKAKQQSLKVHLQRLNGSCQITKNLSLKMINILLEQSPPQKSINILESNALQMVLKMIKNNPSPTQQKIIYKFLTLLINKVSKVNENITEVLIYKITQQKQYFPISSRCNEFFWKLEQKNRQNRFSLL